MSVSLLEVIESAGYNLKTLEDAQWLLARVTEFEALVVEAENLVEEEAEKQYQQVLEDI